MKLEQIKHPHLAEAYAEMAGHSTLPLWEIYTKLVSFKPRIAGVPHIWRYAELKPLLMKAGGQISAEEAERRVLVLKNPGLERPGIAQTLFAGLQLVMPGEVAPAHRHTQGALRFVLESAGGYTTVNGERCLMRPGDFITTPNWAWHDHENTGDGPMIWLDGLDVPIVNFFGAKFAEENEEDQQALDRPDDDSATRWGVGLQPYKRAASEPPYSPIFTYPYERTRAALMALKSSDAADPQHGWKLTYANPRDGGHALPTISAFLQHLPSGFVTEPWRSTEASVFAVAEGRGTVLLGDTEMAFDQNDVLTVPNWTEFRIEAATDCVLFSYSDRAAQERLGIWRETPPS